MPVTFGTVEVTALPEPAAAAPPKASAPDAEELKREMEATFHRHQERARRLWTY